MDFTQNPKFHQFLILVCFQKKQLDCPDLEDGEVEPKEAYDPKRFISYPGFNTPLPDGYYDVSSTFALSAHSI